MEKLEAAIQEAREFLSLNDPKKALEALKSYKKSLENENAGNVQLLDIYADVYLENEQVEKAYSLLVRACDLDPNGEIGGCEKFFALGQIAGGFDGINSIMKGIENIKKKYNDNLTNEQVDKVVFGLLAIIEIWMTDLCMEPNAESQCEEMISKALEVSKSESPEVWSMLGSIRISQNRLPEAIKALEKSWEYFKLRKEDIEQNLKNSSTQVGFRSYNDYIEMLQPLLSLARMSVELGLYDNAFEVLNAVKGIDEDNIEAYYLEGFINYLICKSKLFKIKNPSVELSLDDLFDFNQRLRQLPIDLENEAFEENIRDARIALSFVLKMGENSEKEDQNSQELVQEAQTLLHELGGCVDVSELKKIKIGEKIDAQDELMLDKIAY